MLKATLETLDGVDDAVKAFYAEDGGKFILQLDGVDGHPLVSPLKNAFERTKTEKAASAAKVTALEAQLAEAIKGKPDEAAVLKLRADLEAERDDWKGKFEATSQALTGVTRDRALSDALASAGITNPTFIKAAQAMLAGAVKMDGGKAVVETDMGAVPLGDHVKRWVAGEGKAFVTPASGGGAKGNEGGGTTNTVTRAQFDSMSQGARAAHSKSGGKVVD